MKIKIYIIIILIPIIGLMSFFTEKEDTLIKLFVKGKIINLKTNEPLKRIPISINTYHEKYEDSLLPEHFIDIIAPYPVKTNSKGEFFVEIFYNKKYLDFYLFHAVTTVERGFGDLHIVATNLDTTKISDTLDLGDIYFVPYDNEYELMYSDNRKIQRKKSKNKFEKFNINQVDSIFKIPSDKYNMQIETIDTSVSIVDQTSCVSSESIRKTETLKSLQFIRIVK